MKTLPRVATEMAMHVLAYNLTRVMNIVGAQPRTASSRVHPFYWSLTLVLRPAIKTG